MIRWRKSSTSTGGKYGRGSSGDHGPEPITDAFHASRKFRCRWCGSRVTVRPQVPQLPAVFRLFLDDCRLRYYKSQFAVTLGQKIRYLRTVEGGLRGFGRPMTQLEVVQAMKRKLKKTLSQPYLSQIESGKRPHLTGPTRALLARFFEVHPGFLVDDPPGFDANLESDLRTSEGKLDVWLVHLAERFENDAPVSEALVRIAGQKDTRSAVILLGSILAAPDMEARVRRLLTQKAGALLEVPRRQR